MGHPNSRYKIVRCKIEMELGVIRQKLRPLKIAFLIEPNNRKSLLKAIQTCTFLWGGQFNPIIAAYRSRPSHWEPLYGKNLSVKNIVKGWIDTFDPDYVAGIGNVVLENFDLGNRKKIDFIELEKSILGTGNPIYGVSVYDLANDFLERECTFERRYPIRAVFPKIENRWKYFSASLFGSFNSDCDKELRSVLQKNVKFEEPEQFDASYFNYLGKNILLPINFSTFHLKWANFGDKLRGNRIFLCDGMNIGDVLDFWNLRALGWSITPVPIQFIEERAFLETLADFVEKNYMDALQRNRIEPATLILKSRSISNEYLEEFRKSLPLIKNKKSERGKIMQSEHFPRIWDETYHWYDQVGLCDIECKKKEIQITDLSSYVEYSPLKPEFDVTNERGVKAMYANEVELRAYGGDELIASVLPEGDPNVLFAIGATFRENWRISRFAAVNLCGPYESGEQLKFPLSEEVFKRWFQTLGWEIELSTAGRLAKQMLKHLGGIYGLQLIANKEIIDLIESLSDKRGNSEHTHSLSNEEFWGRIRKAANQSEHFGSAAHLLNSLLDSDVFRLGILIQCPTCQQRSWLSLTELDYNLTCKKCSEKFKLATYSPDDLKWHYKATGPFAIQNKALGAFTTLLCIHFFERLMHASTSPMLSFEITDLGLEVDLAMHIAISEMGRNTQHLVFFECKSKNEFNLADRKRMEKLAEIFPSAVLVFATMKNELNEKEKRILRPLANKYRKSKLVGRYQNPVLIITGNELYGAFSITKTWEKVGGKHEKFAKRYKVDNNLQELCDASHELYLGMEPWYEWFSSKLEKKKQSI